MDISKTGTTYIGLEKENTYTTNIHYMCINLWNPQPKNVFVAFEIFVIIQKLRYKMFNNHTKCL